MPRRLALSLAAVLAVLGITTIALASGDGTSSKPATTTTGSATAAAARGASSPAAAIRGQAGKGARGHRRGPHGAMFKALRGMVLSGGAKRLGVSTEQLKDAVKAVAADRFAARAEQAKLSGAEKQALQDCRRHNRGQSGTTCDRTAARSAFKKLRALPRPDLGDLNTELSAALAKELGLSAGKVLDAARAELSARLDQGAKLGFVTADARKQALACFDTPDDCDVKALHRQFRGAHGRGHGKPGAAKHGRRGHGNRRPAAASSGRPRA